MISIIILIYLMAIQHGHRAFLTFDYAFRIIMQDISDIAQLGQRCKQSKTGLVSMNHQ